MRHLYLYVFALFLGTLLLDLTVWGALPGLGSTGRQIEAAAHREHRIAVAYIAAGTPLGEAFPWLRETGASWLRQACGDDGLARIDEAPRVAMDIVLGPTRNGAHRRLKLAYHAPPWLLLMALAAYAARPRQVSLMGRR